jgi:hypothetical protein
VIVSIGGLAASITVTQRMREPATSHLGTHSPDHGTRREERSTGLLGCDGHARRHLERDDRLGQLGGGNAGNWDRLVALKRNTIPTTSSG